MKTLALLLTLVAAFLLAACESAGPTTSTEPRGTPLGDSNVHVSGTVQAGGSVSNH